MSETKEKIIAILSEIERPGMDAVINYLNTSNYFKCWGGGHHHENGGLAVNGNCECSIFGKIECSVFRNSSTSFSVTMMQHFS